MICGSDQFARPGCPCQLGCYEKEKGRNIVTSAKEQVCVFRGMQARPCFILYPVYQPETTWPDYERRNSLTPKLLRD